MRGTISLLIVLAAALLLDLRVAIRGNPAPIPEADMKAAREKILSMQRPGDLVVHSPLFSVAELQPLGDLRATPDLPAPPIRTSRRVLVLDRRDQEMYGFGSATEELHIGDVLVLRVFGPSGPPSVTLYDLHSALDQAKMRVERPEGNVTATCNAPRAEGGWSCPGEAEWLYLAQRTLPIGGAQSPCVWAHPTTGGVVVIELPAFPAPAAGKKLTLELSGGMTDEAVTTTPDGDTVTIAVRQSGATKGSLQVPNRAGWHRASIVLDPNAPAELRVTTGRDGRRHHCLNARVSEVEAK